MKKLFRIAPAAVLVFVAATALAQSPVPVPGPAPTPAATSLPAPAPVASPVRLTLDLGAVNATGNTSVTNLNVGDRFEYKSKAAGVVQFANVIYGRIGDSTTAEQIKVGMLLDHRIWMVLHGYVGVTFERNRFAGIDRRFEETAGLGIRLLDLPRSLWTFEAGSAVNQQRSTIATIRNFLSLRFATVIRHNFTQTTFISESAESLPSVEDSKDYRINSETSLVAPLSGRLALKISYLVHYDNEPEPGFKKSDRILSSGIQIAF